MSSYYGILELSLMTIWELLFKLSLADYRTKFKLIFRVVMNISIVVLKDIFLKGLQPTL